MAHIAPYISLNVFNILTMYKMLKSIVRTTLEVFNLSQKFNKRWENKNSGQPLTERIKGAVKSNPSAPILLRNVLNSENFVLKKKIPFKTDNFYKYISNILVYEYKKDVKLEKEFITLPLKLIGKDITVRLR